MNKPSLRFGIVGITLCIGAIGAQAAVVVAAANPPAYSFSSSTVCPIQESCTDQNDVHVTGGAFSTLTKVESYVPTSSDSAGYVLSSSASGSIRPGHAELFAQSNFEFHGGQSQLQNSPLLPSLSKARVLNVDTVTISGTGSATIVVPWLITGNVVWNVSDLTPGPGVLPRVTFSTLCFSYPASSTTGLSYSHCPQDFGSQLFTGSGVYNQLLLFEFDVLRGEPFSLQTEFKLSAFSGRGQLSAILADFSHTALQQPAWVLDGNRNTILNPGITSASGLNYFNPQAAVAAPPPNPPGPPNAAPEPASLGLVIVSLGLAWRSRRR